MYYLAYDVETANADFQGSICQIGWVLFSSGGVIRQGSSLIDPQISFSRMCVKIHGITAEAVKGAPTFAEYWESTLGELMASAMVVAYNALFDIRATALALRRYGLPDPGIDYLDLLPVCRALIPSTGYTLADMMAWAHADFTHHRAEDDALAIVRVLSALRQDRGYRSCGEVFQAASSCIASSTHLTLPDEVPPVMPEPDGADFVCYGSPSALAGLNVCVTGDYFEGSGREDVEALIRENGGTVKSNVTKKVRYLVCGDYDKYPPGYQSTKARKAQELRDAGCQIDNVTLSQLLVLIESLAGRPER